MNIFCFGDVIRGDQVWWVSINLQSNRVIVIGQFFLLILIVVGLCGVWKKLQKPRVVPVACKG